METEQRIEEYVKLYGAVQERVGDSDVSLAILHELSKDRRMAQIVQDTCLRMQDEVFGGRSLDVFFTISLGASSGTKKLIVLGMSWTSTSETRPRHLLIRMRIRLQQTKKLLQNP